ncbi:MAG: MXAN_5187 family protein [Kofleriaceae bacterium]
MFLSKIWFFLVALAGAIALTIALVMPRPAQRTLVAEEQQRLVVACGVVDILLGDDARNRVDLAGKFSRTPEIVGALETAGAQDKLDEARMKSVRDVGEKVINTIQGRKPDFAMLIDKRGRVVARVALDANDFGDVAAGRPLVDDALAGYLRDDLWAHNGTMYFVSAAPVIKRDPPVAYVGAVVLGHQVTNALAQRLVKSLDVELGFYLGKDDVAGSKSLAVDAGPMLDIVKKSTGEIGRDCQANKPLAVTSGKDDYTAIVARLPGEAASKNAFYSVMIKRPTTIGFAGTMKVVTQSDLSFGNFPWILVGGAFLVVLAIGIVLMLVEADRPLKRLAADAVRLAKGETERLSEDAHGGKFGSIARSVNIHIDKLGREAKTAKKDLDQLLGPAPEGSLGTIDLLATALPSVRPGGPASPAPVAPSDFKFNDPPPSLSVPARPTPMPGTAAPPPKPAFPPVSTPPPKPMPAPRTPTPPAFAATPPPPAAPLSLGDALDDDILGGADKKADDPQDQEAHFKQVFEQFVSVKKSCGEPTSGLTYPKFAEKLVKNRDDLMAKTGCKEVRFTVYVKDGKAALKATPVKDE